MKTSEIDNNEFKELEISTSYGASNKFGMELAVPKNKTIILLTGKKTCRNKVSKYLLNILDNESEALQFGFFLKTYASKITDTTEQFIHENKYDLIVFKTENILNRIHECVNDTAARLNQPYIAYNKMALLAIFNYLFFKNYRLEHEIEESLSINLYDLIKQIGQIWKIVFTNTIWSDLVITAIKRSNYPYIIVDDFRFPEEYAGLRNENISNVHTIKIIDDINSFSNDEGIYNYQNNELDKFNFDYMVNCTINSNIIATEYIKPQIYAILESINYLQSE